MSINVIKMFSGNLPSLKSVLIGGRLIDCFNDQNNDLNVIVLKSDNIFNVTVPNVSLKRTILKEKYLYIQPITDICDKIIKNERTIVFSIGNNEFHVSFIYKDDNYKYGYDETCVLGVDIINNENYQTVLPFYRLSNYENIKVDLKHGIELECFGLFNIITTPTSKLAIITGKSLHDGTTQLLIFEYIGE